MLAAIYRLRAYGVLLPRPDEPRHGDLVLAKNENSEGGLCAQLKVDGRDILPPLFQAQVTRISRHGMVIKGREVSSRVPGSKKAKVTLYDQTWWVLIHTEDFMVFHENLDPLDVESRPNDALGF